MVKLRIGGGEEEKFEPLPAMRGALLFLQSAEFLEADREKGYEDRIKWVFEVIGNADDEFIGKTHHVYTNMPHGKSGKVSTRSNLYALLEGMSGGEFEPDDEIDTDDYVGRNYTGDFKREQSQEKVGNEWKPKFVEGKPVKKTVLRNLYPAPEQREAKPARQSGYRWNDDDSSDDDE